MQLRLAEPDPERKNARGRVSQMFPIDEYGYIEAEDGHEVYFQKSKGPQASTVRLVHPRRVHRSPRTAPGARVVR